jgi:hypothetical protein
MEVISPSLVAVPPLGIRVSAVPLAVIDPVFENVVSEDGPKYDPSCA